MSDKSIAVDIGPIEGGNAVEKSIVESWRIKYACSNIYNGLCRGLGKCFGCYT
jgi:hypothetical protein